MQTGSGQGVGGMALREPHTGSTTPLTMPCGNRRAHRFANASPPPAADTWQAVPEWATWLTLGLALLIVALLLGAIIYLLG